MPKLYATITEQRVRSIRSPNSVQVIDRAKMVARAAFFCGGALGLGIARVFEAVTILDYGIAIITMGFLFSGGLTFLFLFNTTMADLEPDTITKTEEFEPEEGERPDIEPFRISGNGYTAVIDQPEPGAFVRWAAEVLDNPRTYFSLNQSNDRGFGYKQVVDGLRRVGVLEARPDKNNVYHVVTGNGRARLEEAIGRRPTP